MSSPRLLFVVLFTALTGAAGYLSLHGIGGESSDARSFRERSVGGPGFIGRVK